MKEELNDRGNGGDSDDDLEDARHFNNTMKEVNLERSHVLSGYDGIEQADDGRGELCVASCWGHYVPR